jgi:hypothetical protein
VIHPSLSFVDFEGVCDVTSLMVLDNLLEIFQFRKNANRTNRNTSFELFDRQKSIPNPHYTRVKLSS